MNFVIRTDSSVLIGSGHVMRCLTLAAELRKKNAKILFISREQPGTMIPMIEKQGYKVFRLPKGVSDWKAEIEPIHELFAGLKPSVDWLIVDHYELDRKWEEAMRPFVRNIMVIDDLADRKHECDLLLDQNYFQNRLQRYDQLVPSRCKKVLGPRYALLNPEVLKKGENIRERDGTIRSVLVCFGGSDPTNETEKALQAIQMLNQGGLHFDVVVGGLYRNKEKIRKRCQSIPNVTFYEEVSNLASLMAKADLSLGAGGISNWERCYLGLPSIIIVVARNQESIAAALEDAGTAWNLGWHFGVNPRKIAEALSLAIKSREKLVRMGKKGRELMGGKQFQGAPFLASELFEGKYAAA